MRRAGAVGALAAVVLSTGILAGCAGTSDQAQQDASHALRQVAVTTPSGPTTTTGPVPQCDPLASLRPTGPLPAPGQMPPGSTMAKIQARGRLVVGVDQNTKLFAYRNPRTGELEGFEIELLRDLAAAILGDPNAIEFRTVTTPNRIPAVSDPSTDVDVVASLVTMTCARWQQVLFSSEYYAAAQKVMVRGDATTIQSVADLAGKKVCATAGSTSIQNIAARIPTAKIVAVDSRIDCLVKFQEGTVDAITADDTILAGFQEQDSRATKILDESLEPEPYGMIFRNDHADLVRFTNALLDQMRADGRLAQLGQTWLGAEAAPVPPARYQP